MSKNPWGEDKVDIEWREFELELYDDHCEIMNTYMKQYQDGRYKHEMYHSFNKVLTKQNGGDYHGWLVILGAMLSEENGGGSDYENVEIEKNINRTHPDLLCHDSKTVVEAGSPGLSTLRKRAGDLVRSMLYSKEFSTKKLTQWKFINIPKDVFVRERFEEDREFVLSANPTCKIVKPTSISVDLDRSGMGFWVPGWGNISEDKKPPKYDPDHYTNISVF